MAFQALNIGTQQGAPEVVPPYIPSFGGFIDRAKQSFAERDANVQQIRQDTANKPIQGVYRAAGQVAGLVGDVATDFIAEGLRPEVKQQIKGGFQAVLSTQPAQNVAANYQAWKAQHPDLAANLEATVNIASILPVGTAPTVVARGFKAADKAADATAAATRPLTNAARTTAKATGNIVTPKPTPSAAVGQVLQAKKPITPGEVRAFREIDTSNVKTYADLQKQVDTSISKLSGQVDEVLGQDPTPIPLSQLSTKTTTGSGKVIERNYVQTAIEHLRELYQKTFDDVGAADMDDLLVRAQANGLSRLEVNKLARQYNSEFGDKAFSKTGDPLTSVNAQGYENVRGGLKDVARQSIGGTAAANTDQVISSLYSVKDLVKKNVAAVQRLEQKINKRGLLEKAGHAITTAADTISGGLLRGLVSGMIMRGQGFKVMNALDLEANLKRNLEIINKALDADTDDALINAAKELQRSRPTPSAIPTAVPSPKPTMLEKGKALFNKIKTEGKRGFIAIPSKAKLPDPAKIAKNMDAKDLKIIRTYLDVIDGKTSGTEAFIEASLKADALLEKMGVKVKSLSDEAKTDYLMSVRDFFEDPPQGRDNLGRFTEK